MFSNLTELQVFPIDNDFKGHTEESLTKEVIHFINTVYKNSKKKKTLAEHNARKRNNPK